MPQTEANFHIIVDRTRLRDGNPAWERANPSQVPSVFAAWVDGEQNEMPNGKATMTRETAATTTSN